MKNKTIYPYAIIFSLLITISSVFFNSNVVSNYFENNNIHAFEKEILYQQEVLKENVNTLNNLLNEKPHKEEYIKFSKKLQNLTKEQTSIYVFKNNIPLYWTNNLVAFDNFKIDKLNEPYVSLLGNGWYIVYVKKNEAKNFYTIGLTLIKREFIHQNKYLQNNISSIFSLQGSYHFSYEEEAGSKPIKNGTGNILFYLNKNIDFVYTFNETLFSLLSLLGILLLFVFIYNYFCYWYKILQKKYLLWFYYGAIIAIWLIIFLSEFPYQYFNSELFSPTLYAESALQQSLGHFIINIYLLFFGVYMFYTISYKEENKYINFSGITFYTLPFIGVFISASIRGLIENSSISWGLNDIFSLNIFSYLSFLCIGLLFLIYFLIAEKSTRNFLQSTQKKAVKISLLIIPYILAYIVSVKWHIIKDPVFTLWSVPLLIYFIYARDKERTTYSFFSILLYIMLFSLAGAYFIEKTVIQKEHKEEKTLAIRIGEDKDPVAEFLFTEVVNDITTDKFLIDSIDLYMVSKPILTDYLQKKYFSGYWNKFDIRFTFCRPSDSLTISPLNITENCIEYIEKQQYSVDFSRTNQLLYVNAPEGGVSYIAKVKIYDAKSSDKGALSLYIEFFSKIFPKTEGYPELLLDENEIKQALIPEENSFAKYKTGTLMKTAGEYKYPLSSDVLPIDSATYSYTAAGYYHHVYRNENTLVILGKKQKTFLNHITAFSYLFVFYGLVLFFCLLVFFRKSITINFSSFSNKLQLFLVSFILFSITLFGIGTSYYISVQYKQKNYKAISEKLRSVLTELESKLANYESLDASLHDYITYYLIKFSNVFYSDINLYNTKGELIATSRQEVFNVGLLGTQINQNAYKQLSLLKCTEFIHEEQIGKLKYLSGYIPFYNNKDELLAYLNLPYFAKQNELEKEISTFLVAIINVYVLLFVLSIIIAFLFSSYLTKPLRMLREKIAGVELGKTNELLEWEGEDEIGSLVKEYNRMVIELVNSAEQLAKSERETAWREMAKQVAHEIKNPLTPMKLSIQHLKRAFDDGAPDLNKRVEKTTQTLIEQIETLSHIASEFSSFAKMPVSQNKNILPETILKNVVSLYAESENIEVSYSSNIECEKAEIVADHDQINRVFNNLIKNAIQAIPEGENGHINVSAVVKNKQFIVKITDNGTGISNELLDKIFVPNFTTKTGGAGLGLAMVKNIVENCRGKIWFETKINEGTSFYVSWPVIN